jgi:hypothetical protein
MTRLQIAVIPAENPPPRAVNARDSNESGLPPPSNTSARRKGIVIGILLASISLFMYVSFIIKTAVKGP